MFLSCKCWASFTPPPGTNVIYGQVLRENSDVFCDVKKLYECTLMPFWFVLWIDIDVYGIYQVMVDGFYTFKRNRVNYLGIVQWLCW